VVEVTQNLAGLRILHQVDDWTLAARSEYPDVGVQPFVDHRAQRARPHRRIVRIECLRTFVRRLVAAEVFWRIRHGVDVRLGSVRRGETDFVTTLDEGHRGYHRLVEVLSGGAPTAALRFDPSCVGTDDEDFSFTHDSLWCDSRAGVRGVRIVRTVR